jgi:hypothetical protein
MKPELEANNTNAPSGVLLRPVVGSAKLERIDDAIQRLRKGIAECNERIYEKALADFGNETKDGNAGQ